MRRFELQNEFVDIFVVILINIVTLIVLSKFHISAQLHEKEHAVFIYNIFNRI